MLTAAKEKKWNIRIVGAPNVVDIIGNVALGMKSVPIVAYKSYLPASNWPNDLMSNYDLFVIPLAHEYDRSRSPIKAIECILAGVPWIATDNGVYQDFAQFGTTVQNSQESWYNAILHSMEKNEAQKQAAMSARNYVKRHYMIEDNVPHLLEVWTP